MVAVVTTNGQANGNAHVTMPMEPAGSGYHVVLKQGPNDRYASSPVTLN
jgi:hypothetical protein